MGLGKAQSDSGLGKGQIAAGQSKEKMGLGKAQLIPGLSIKAAGCIIPVGGMDQTQRQPDMCLPTRHKERNGPLSSGVVWGPGQCRNKGFKALNNDTCFKGKSFSGHTSKRKAIKLFVKIKPKKVTCFEHRNILSSQDQEFVKSKNFLQRGPCSLGRSLSPINKERDRIKECLPPHQRGINIELYGLSNYAATSRIIEDIEIESDGDALFSI